MNPTEPQLMKPDQAPSDEKTAQEALAIYKYCFEAKRRNEYEWYVNDQFYENNQYLKYNVASRRVQAIPVEKLLDRVVVNKVFQIVRGIVAYLNREHPQVEIRPGSQGESAYLNAKKEKHLVDYWYDHLNMNQKIKQITLDACKYGIGWAKIMWDKDALAPTAPFKLDTGDTKDRTYGEVEFERVDPFEVYPDPLARSMGDMRYVVHALSRTIGELQSNPHYRNTEDLKPDNKTAASYMKESQYRQDQPGAAAFYPAGPDALKTILVLEVYRKEFVNGEWKVRLTTITQTGICLRDEVRAGDIPFEFYQTEVVSGVAKGKGVIHNIRELNRALSQMFSQIHESARLMGKLNWLIPRGSNINVITDEQGQFIEYDVTPGGKPEPAQISGLPSYIPQHVQNLIALMDDIGGQQAASQGKQPFSQASGKIASTLQEADSSNLAMLRDNLDDFLVRCFKLMLRTARRNYQTSRTIRSAVKDPLGEYSWIHIDPKDISVEDDIQVRSGTNMPYSLADKQELYIKLWNEKIITDPAIMAKLLEIPDIDNSMGDDELDVQRQLDENRKLVGDKTVEQPVISENHSVHIRVIDKLARSPKWEELSPDIQKRILDHRGAHIDLSIQLTKIQQSLQSEPIKRSEVMQYRISQFNEFTPIERTQALDKFGINSDAAQIQVRGGLFIQDPKQAAQQAQAEDVEMMNGNSQQVSFGDNHQVHLQVHSEIVSDPNFKNFPKYLQDIFNDHVKGHLSAQKAILMNPGLVPDEHSSQPAHPAVPSQPDGAKKPQKAPKATSPKTPDLVEPIQPAGK